MWGDLYQETNDLKKAVFFYNKSLTAISDQKNRIGMKVELLEKVSAINQKLGNQTLAYQQLLESKTLGDSLFGSQSRHNRQLFEIKDTYRKSILENQRIRNAQMLKLANLQKDKLYMRWVFAIVLLAITILASLIILQLLRRKYTIENRLTAERANAEIELNKKELAVTALQLMEKDKLLSEVKEGLLQLKKDTNNTSVDKINNTINIHSLKTWEEFELRFVQVNSGFYKALSEQHPDLSRNELKLSALIKLNFSTKEMAHLLGVSTDGVNKARYRLRKKLGLQRDDNLSAYINGLK
jgi:DNA-binding CsgD family transcriptional regulator